jgi:hypothetical protein
VQKQDLTMRALAAELREERHPRDRRHGVAAQRRIPVLAARGTEGEAAMPTFEARLGVDIGGTFTDVVL